MFDQVIVDLPLRWIGSSRKGEGKSPRAHYAATDVPGLIRLLKPMLDSCMAKSGAAGFWVYGPRLPDTLAVIEGTGFVYKSELLTWFKTCRIRLGKATRKVVENISLATRGKGLPIVNHGVRQNVDSDLPLTIEAARLDDSVKPDKAYATLVRLFGPDVRRLDLYARRRRQGLTPWG
jgi:N6-adenosine-specific RNA methylase IME4